MSLFPVFSPAAVTPATANYLDESGDIVNRTVYSFTSQTIGSSADSHKVVVYVASRVQGGADTPDSVDIGSDVGTIVDNIAESGNINRGTMWEINAITATSGTVTVTFPAGQLNCEIIIWEVFGAAASKSASGTDGVNSTGSVSIAIPANGCAIGGDNLQGTTSSGASTWVNITEDFTNAVDYDSFMLSGASKNVTATETLTMTHHWTTPAQATPGMLIIASWAPA